MCCEIEGGQVGSRVRSASVPDGGQGGQQGHALPLFTPRARPAPELQCTVLVLCPVVCGGRVRQV